MAIPVNNEGNFEVVDGNDVVVGSGHIGDDNYVRFTYGDSSELLMPLADFENVISVLPQFQSLTIRAAGT